MFAIFGRRSLVALGILALSFHPFKTQADELLIPLGHDATEDKIETKEAVAPQKQMPQKTFLSSFNPALTSSKEEQEERADEFIYRMRNLSSCLLDESYPAEDIVWQLGSYLAYSGPSNDAVSESGLVKASYTNAQKWCSLREKLPDSAVHDCVKEMGAIYARLATYFKGQIGEEGSIFGSEDAKETTLLSMIPFIRLAPNNIVATSVRELRQAARKYREKKGASLRCDKSPEQLTAINDVQNNPYDGRYAATDFDPAKFLSNSLPITESEIIGFGADKSGKLKDKWSFYVENLQALGQVKGNEFVREALRNGRKTVGINSTVEALAYLGRRFRINNGQVNGNKHSFSESSYAIFAMLNPDEGSKRYHDMIVLDAKTGKIKQDANWIGFGYGTRNCGLLGCQSGSGRSIYGEFLFGGLYNSQKMHGRNKESRFVAYQKETFDKIYRTSWFRDLLTRYQSVMRSDKNATVRSNYSAVRNFLALDLSGDLMKHKNTIVAFMPFIYDDTLAIKGIHRDPNDAYKDNTDAHGMGVAMHSAAYESNGTGGCLRITLDERSQFYKSFGYYDICPEQMPNDRNGLGKGSQIPPGGVQWNWAFSSQF